MSKTNKFLELLEHTGDIAESCFKSGLGYSEYSDLYSTDANFKKETDSRLLQNQLTLDNRIRRLGRERAIEQLENGIEVRKVKKKLTYNHGDGGSALERTEVTQETHYLPVPQWLIQYAIGGDIEQALNILARESMIPKEKVREILSILISAKKQVRVSLGESTSTNKGLDEMTVAVAQSELLGIPLENIQKINDLVNSL